MHRAPVAAGSVVVLRAILKEAQGRKHYLSGTLESKDGKLLADATSLFICVHNRPRNNKPEEGHTPPSLSERAH